MPGFVNCHSHVEYSTFRGILDDAEFGDWIISLVDVKASLTPDEYLMSARLGAIEAISSGITTIADTSYSGVTLEAAAEAGLRGRLYLEVFGVDDTRLDETMRDVERRLAACPGGGAAALRRRARAARALHRLQPPVPGRVRLRPEPTASRCSATSPRAARSSRTCAAAPASSPTTTARRWAGSACSCSPTA